MQAPARSSSMRPARAPRRRRRARSESGPSRSTPASALARPRGWALASALTWRRRIAATPTIIGSRGCRGWRPPERARSRAAHRAPLPRGDPTRHHRPTQTAIATLYMPLGSFTRSEFYSTALYGTFRGAAGRPWKRFEILGAAMAEIRDNKGIEVDGLVREFKNGPRAVDGIDLHVAPGEIYGFLGPNGAGQVDHRPDAHHAAAADRRARRGSPASTSSARGRRCARSIGAALQEAALDPFLTGREHMRLQTALHGLPKRRARRARRRAARARRPDRGRRPQGRRLLGRDEAPARPGAGARPPAAHPLPRRADHRPRHPEPHRAVGRGRAARRRGRRHRLPHHPVPGGGRRARRPRRDHRPRQDRRRGHAGRAEGRDRPADGRGDAARPAEQRAAWPPCSSASASAPAPRRRASRCGSTAASRSWPRSSARSTPRGSRSSTCSSTRRRSTTSSWPRPAARWRARATRRRPTGRAAEAVEPA